MRLFSNFGLTACCLAVVLSTTSIRAADSPAFRGVRGDGQSDEQVPVKWSAKENVRWRIALPFAGHSTPVISRGRVFLTCANKQGTQRGLYCYDRKTGKELWKQVVAFSKVEPTHKTNPYGASSPVTDG
ncbi:MAG: serine/threonine protein kinase, partial [Planctomycetaceae bacterium]|nr:serine/threonine protein kinase [Planctomycetaceae bacterium]